MSQTLTKNISSPDLKNRYHASPKKIQRFQHHVVSEASDAVVANYKITSYIKWFFINLFLSICFYCGCLQKIFFHFWLFDSNLLQYADYGFLFFCVWNTLINFLLFCSLSWSKLSVQMNVYQKKLLGIRFEHENLVHITDEITNSNQKKAPEPSSLSYPIRRTPPRPLRSSPGNSPSRSQFSPSRTQFSPSRNVSQSYSYPYTSTPSPKTFHDNSSPTTLLNSSKSSPAALNTSGAKKTPRSGSFLGRANICEEELLDYDAVEKYINKEEITDQRTRRAQPEPSKQYSAWSFQRAAYDYLPSFGTYQLAIKSQTPSSKDDDVNIESPYKFDEVWRDLGLSGRNMDHWTENLRKWLAQSVLEPLVKEISSINTRLTQLGCPELHIGTVSQLALQNLASSKTQQLPSLPSVILYLEVSPNQEYLVSRLKELATGGCLRLYKWDGGGTFKNNPWNSDLPTDAQVLMHLFCTYMDTHLPANPRYPSGKSFSGLYFLKTPAKTSERTSNLSLYQSRIQPPHFKLLVENNVIDLPKGRNNIFYAIVLFLYHAKRDLHGMLERVNLGMSGINILWVLEKK
ncbi:transmembrane protein 209 isoform X2 [Hydra vulgaris]|uniref:Transmembrane protein 209 isoform X2 n=1 Tax=Hydra vulgaris TaxID=6087 RepID=A0ABM4DIR8_HYDVU